ncbi:MAG: hypothetical protein L3K23_10975, partial [Thermoplasmata archaeon]|nr:hypothetical protein [Thermoplasmata archaeon]
MITNARERAGGTAGTNGRSMDARRRHVALALTALLVVSAFFIYGLPSARGSPMVDPTGSSTTTLHGASVAAASSVPAVPSSMGAASGALRFSPHPAGTPSASGRGTFFDTTNLSHPGLQNLSCGKPYYFYPTFTCPNTTFDPSINVTSSGVIGVAYTVWTNYTHCPGVANLSNNTTLDVAFQSSTNGGVSWNPMLFLGNQNCSAAQNLSNSWEPSLTSLSNGTLVLAYVQFSDTTCSSIYCSRPYTPDIYPYQIPYADLVVQESYNGGANWTAPAVVNSTFNPSAVSAVCSSATGFPAFRPSIAASGNSVYLAWENLTDANGCSREYSAGVHLITSSNGGVNWSAPVNFPTIGDGGHPLYNYYATGYSVNPFVLAASNGQVYVTYATGLSYTQNYCQPSGCYPYGISTMDVVVANATGGVGNWTVRTAVNNTGFSYQSGSGNYGGFVGISPQIGYNGVNGQLYLVFPSVAIGTFCYNPSSCYLGDEGTTAFTNSSNGGANWSQPQEVGQLVNPYHGPENYEFYPTIVVDHNGTAHVMFEYYNQSICAPYSTYSYCGGFEQMYFNTSDNGTSWNGPYVISPYVVPPFDYPYTGEYESATTAPSGQVLFAWTNSFCPPATTTPFCGYQDPYEPESNTTVVVSWLFSGPGVTVTFNETNLTAGARWSAEVLGNYRAALAGTNLAVSGVPPTEPVSWSVPWVNSTPGIAWQSTAAPTNPTAPSAFSANATLKFSFSELVEVQVFVVPPLYYYYLTSGANGATYSMTPLPGSYWVPVNSTMTFTVAPQAITCGTSCYYYNLTWQSWTGTGIGSVSTNATSFTLTVGSTPINETANFLMSGYCYGYSGTLHCYTAKNYPLTFHQTGLPSGTTWGVTTVVNSSAIGTVSSTSTNAWLNVSTGQTAVQFTVWTVPSGTPDMYWVPTTDPGSPVAEPVQTLVNVTYTLQNVTTVQFSANFT